MKVAPKAVMQRFVLAIGSAAQEPLSRKRRAWPWPAVPGLTDKIQSAGVERQLWVGHLRRKARKLLVPPTTSICRPEIKVLKSSF